MEPKRRLDQASASDSGKGNLQNPAREQRYLRYYEPVTMDSLNKINHTLLLAKIPLGGLNNKILVDKRVSDVLEYKSPQRDRPFRCMKAPRGQYTTLPASLANLWPCPKCSMGPEHTKYWDVAHKLGYLVIDEKIESESNPSGIASTANVFRQYIDKSKALKALYAAVTKEGAQVAYFGNLPTDFECQNEFCYQTGEMQFRRKCGFSRVEYSQRRDWKNLQPAAPGDHQALNPFSNLMRFAKMRLPYDAHFFGNYFWVCPGCSVEPREVGGRNEPGRQFAAYVLHPDSRYVRCTEWAESLSEGRGVRLAWVNANWSGSGCMNIKFGQGPDHPNRPCSYIRGQQVKWEQVPGRNGAIRAIRPPRSPSHSPNAEGSAPQPTATPSPLPLTPIKIMQGIESTDWENLVLDEEDYGEEPVDKGKGKEAVDSNEEVKRDEGGGEGMEDRYWEDPDLIAKDELYLFGGAMGDTMSDETEYSVPQIDWTDINVTEPEYDREA
ncbi:hypothetical protein P280DRAFT_503331 [Massarina eburnea CBS 473.64]|uniref:Uncharacterized protein n=1 Tax=Massarina eburnea CBS 473.64 TaxID=1395130 RepID=A0A6A6SG13_9PLEO|nr:hypothetical protein P280DRAFT_503331 [Massarina eburnea CBS 473.64]